MKKNHTGTLARSIAIVLAALAALAGCASGKKQTQAGTAASVPVSVTAVNPVERKVQDVLSANGILHAKNELNVVAETSGKVVQVLADEGTFVRRGDVVALLDDELKLAAYKTAQASYEKSTSDRDRAQKLFAQKVISDSELQGVRLAFAGAESQYLTAKRDYENARVRSPLDGVVTQRFVTAGSMLSPGTPVVHVVDTSALVLTIQVGERDILKVRENMEVAVESDLYPNGGLRGTVTAVSPKGDAALSFPVDIALAGDAAKPLYAGMSARARVDTGSKSILAIPRSALVGSGDDARVYLIKDGRAFLKGIRTGSEYDTDIEVLSGLSASDRVVSEGQNNLVDGAAVTVTENSQK